MDQVFDQQMVGPVLVALCCSNGPQKISGGKPAAMLGEDFFPSRTATNCKLNPKAAQDFLQKDNNQVAKSRSRLNSSFQQILSCSPCNLTELECFSEE